MHIQIIGLDVKDGHATDFLDAFRINYEGTRKEPGNLRFDVLRDLNDPNRFLVYEIFTMPEALEEHRKTDHYKECIRRIEPLLAAPRTKTLFHAEMADFLL